MNKTLHSTVNQMKKLEWSIMNFWQKLFHIHNWKSTGSWGLTCISYECTKCGKTKSECDPYC